MLEEIIAHKWTKAQAIIGFWPANSFGDDIIVKDALCENEIGTFHTLRQQMRKNEDRPNYALSDFIAPLVYKIILAVLRLQLVSAKLIKQMNLKLIMMIILQFCFNHYVTDC